PETPVTEGGQEETRQLNQSLPKNEAQDKVQQKTAIPRAIKRDPTMPADYLAKPARIDGDKDIKGELILTAIFSYPDYRCAVINDQVLKVGDVIAGQMIEEIHERSVRLRDSKEITELNLFIPNMITYLEEQNLNKKDSILPP